jgi:SOS-response transcriptional repressor LexA
MSNRVSWRERLRLAIDSSGRKHSAVAADAGITPVTLSRILNSVDVNPSFETVVRIAHAVNENVGWLIEEPGFSLSAGQLKKLAEALDFLENTLHIAAATPDSASASLPNAAVEKESDIPRREYARGARLVYRAIDASMSEAGIADGDLVFVRPTRDFGAADGCIVVCRLGPIEVLRQLHVRAGRIRLLSRSRHYPPIDVARKDEIELIGVVVGRSGPPAI